MIVTLAEMKTFLGVTGTDDDAFLQSQIDLVTAAIEAYCGRKFEETEYIQTFYRYDWRRKQRKVPLYQFPITELVYVTFEGAAQPFPVNNYRVYKQSGSIDMSDCFSSSFIEGNGNVIVRFKAGYPVEKIPTPVKYVVYSVVQANYNKKKAGIDLNFGNDVQSISIPGAISVAYDYTLTKNDRTTAFGSIIGDHLNTLDFYRSEVAVMPDVWIEEFVEEAP